MQEDGINALEKCIIMKKSIANYYRTAEIDFRNVNVMFCACKCLCRVYPLQSQEIKG